MNPWDVIGAVTGIATALIGTLVFVEARRIRHTEWLTRSVQMWQDFNSVLLTDDRASRWRAFLEGKVAESDFHPADHYLLYTYLNILYSEYTYAKSGLLHASYASESLQDNLRQIATAGDYVIEYLRFTGYDNELIDQIVLVSKGGRIRFAGRLDGVTSRLTRFVPTRRHDSSSAVPS